MGRCVLTPRLCAWGLAAQLLISVASHAEQPVAEVPAPAPAAAAAASETAEAADAVQYDAVPDRQLRWFFFVGAVNAYPYMKSEKLIRRFYDPAMGVIAPGHRQVNTVGDLRDSHLLWPPQFGMGYELSKRWVFSMQGGWAEGLVRTEEDNASIFFGLPWHEDFQIRRGAGYLGAGFDFYPFGTCQQRKYEGFVDRIKGCRPFVGSSVTMTHATYNATVQIGLKGLPNIGIKLHDRWILPSLNIHYGLDFPVNDRSAISVNAGFNHFWEEEDDFEGWAMSWSYKYLFH